MKKYATSLFAVLAAIMILFAGCTAQSGESGTVSADTTQSTVQAQRQSNGGVTLSNDSAKSFDYSTVPKFDDKPYVEINGNVPYFTKSELTTKSYESYGELDKYGRCTMCIASVGTDLMPTEERGAIGSIKPTGWHTVKYSNVDGKYLYNRCHLIGYQLSGENANAKNLITGTRYLNIDGMLPFENEVGEYVKETDNHVLYRVTPIFVGDELVARGVLMEGYSVEDGGKGVCYNVFCYNNQPGISIDYKTGESSAQSSSDTFDDQSTVGTYIVNTSTKKFHKTTCSSAQSMKEKNKKTYTGNRENLINNGYSPCEKCKP